MQRIEMNGMWLLLSIFVSFSALALSLPQITNVDEYLALPGTPAYYIMADADTSHVGPTDELKRTHRSLWKKLFKNTGLEDLFGDCNGCCNNNCNGNYGQNGGYEAPPAADYGAQSLPLQPLQPLHGFQPLTPWKGLFQTFGLPGAGGKNNALNFGNNYDTSYGGGGNANDGYKAYTQPQPSYGEGTQANYAETPSYANDAPSSNTYTEPQNAPAYEQPNEQPNEQPSYSAPPAGNDYQAPPTPVAENYAKPTYMGNAYDYKIPQIVYQPIIYVSPQYQPGKYVQTKDSTEEVSHDNKAPVAYEEENDNNKYEPEAPTVSDDTQYAPAAAPDYNQQQTPAMPTYTPTITPIDTPCMHDVPMMPPSNYAPPQPYYNMPEHSYSYGSNNAHSGVTTVSAVYTIVAPPVSAPHSSYAEPPVPMRPAYEAPTSYAPPPQPRPAYMPSLSLSLADQPYRVCPELFTEYKLQQTGYGQRY